MRTKKKIKYKLKYSSISFYRAVIVSSRCTVKSHILNIYGDIAGDEK